MDKIMKASLKKYSPAIAISILLSAAYTGLGFIIPMLNKKLIDEIIPQKNMHILLETVTYMFAIYVAINVLWAVKSYISRTTSAKVEQHLFMKYYEKVQGLSVDFFEDRQSGEIASTLKDDTRQVSWLLANMPEEILLEVLNFIVALVILTRLNLPLSAVIIGYIPVYFLAIYFLSKKSDKYYELEREKDVELFGKLSEGLAAIRLINIFNTHNHEYIRIKSLSEDILKADMKTISKTRLLYSVMSLLGQMISFGIIVLGVYMVIKGTATIGVVFAFISYSDAVFGPLSSVTGFVESFQQSKVSIKRIKVFYDAKPSIVEKKNAKERVENGRIEMKNIFFKYPNSSNHVLKNFNLTINKGDNIAIVGASGQGKTSITNILLRLFDAEKGEVNIDGTDIKDYKLNAVRSHTGIVSQDTMLLNDTIENNIRYGSFNATREEVIQASKMANLHDFIETTESGYDTMVGERGIKLSGGQKQRIAIARLILKNPEMIILDEATSALDNTNEKKIKETIDRAFKGKTILTIAHRLSTIQDCSRICLLQDGSIKEQGTHDELISKKGLYYRLYKKIPS